MLAAAGGPDVHPHATDDSSAWLVWERDVANFNTDLRRLEAFFRDLLAGRLTEEEANRKLFSFIDAEGVPQGPFYTVGWKMAAMVERAKGREALVKILCDPRALLAAYNEVAAAIPRSDGEGLATWSPGFLAGLSGKSSSSGSLHLRQGRVENLLIDALSPQALDEALQPGIPVEPLKIFPQDLPHRCG